MHFSGLDVLHSSKGKGEWVGEAVRSSRTNSILLEKQLYTTFKKEASK